MEKWKEIDGFEDLYMVSTFGRIKSLYRNGKLLKPRLDGRKGYFRVDLYKNGKRYTRSVHRLVAEAFVSNPLNLPQINHIDENKANNKVENLEWCDAKYNNNYGKHGTRHLRRDALGRFS